MVSDVNVIVGSSLITGLVFLAEVTHYVRTGVYTTHVLSGAASYAEWSHPAHENDAISFHAIACYAWLLLVGHQVYTRGKGLHRAVGYLAAALAVGAVLLANARVPVTIPHVHTLPGKVPLPVMISQCRALSSNTRTALDFA